MSSLQFSESNSINLHSQRISCFTSTSVIKYRRHPSITAIQDAYKGSLFSFSAVNEVDVIREIKNLNKKKATDDDDTPAKILTENVNVSAEFIFIFNNNAKTTSKFPS